MTTEVLKESERAASTSAFALSKALSNCWSAMLSSCVAVSGRECFQRFTLFRKKGIELAFSTDRGLHELVCHLNTTLPRHEEEANSQGTRSPLLFGENISDGRIVLEALAIFKPRILPSVSVPVRRNRHLEPFTSAAPCE